MGPQEAFKRRLAAIVFADIAGWSRLIERNDAETLRAWKALRSELIEPKIHEHGGRLLEVAGDAVVVEFPSAVAAVSWALDLQHGLAEQAKHQSPHAPGLIMRIGVNVEDVIVDGDKLVGDGVNIAARIHQVAEPGEIVVTKAVRDYVWNKMPLALIDLGERQLKNISRPVRIYRVQLQDERSLAGAAGFPPSLAWTSRTLLAIERTGPGGAGELASSSRSQSIEDLVRDSPLPFQPGRVSKSAAGGVLLEFPSARQAAMSAFAIQNACQRINKGTRPEQQLQLCMGMDVTEPVTNGHGVSAPGMIPATQLSSLAGPGEIVASAGVRDQLTPALDADIEDLGECYAKHAQHSVRAYRIAPPGSVPSIEHATLTGDLRPTIAVIPFTARNNEPEHQILGEVLAEEAILALSHTSEMNVISRLSTTAFRDRKATISEVSAHLNATYVLSGGYLVSGAQLNLSVELAEARSGQVVWAKHFKGHVTGIASGKDEMIHRIVAEISAAVVTRELQRVQSQPLPTLESYTLLMGAITLMHRLSARDFDRARQMLQALIERAPRLAIPQAWMGKWHVLRVQQGWASDTVEEARLALNCTRRALDADPDCSLALTVDGFVHTNLLKQLDVAQERYEHAIRVNPNDALAWLLKGTLHAFKGEGKQAVKETQRALRLSPLDPHRYFYDSLSASAELSAGRYERAIELAQRSMRANRTHTSTLRALAISQWELGRHEDARRTVGELMRIEPTLTVRKWLERSPSSEYAIGKLCAAALHNAGVPA